MSVLLEQKRPHEALMQDGKALQAGTSHFGSKFCKALMCYKCRREKEYVWEFQH
jgi:hypothetical protein